VPFRGAKSKYWFLTLLALGSLLLWFWVRTARQNDFTQWVVRVGTSVGSSVAVGSDGTVYTYRSRGQKTGGYLGELISIDGATGKIRWGFSHAQSMSVLTSPITVAPNGIVYVGFQQTNSQYAVSALTPDGELLWTRKNRAEFLLTDATSAYFGYSGVYACDRFSGKPVWTFATPFKVCWIRNACLWNGTLFFTAEDGTVLTAPVGNPETFRRPFSGLRLPHSRPRKRVVPRLNGRQPICHPQYSRSQVALWTVFVPAPQKRTPQEEAIPGGRGYYRRGEALAIALS
jgi:hypothetical protein